MTKEKAEDNTRKCIDCGKDISNLYHNATRCNKCSQRRKKIKDSIRHKKKKLEQIKWDFFVEDPKTGDIVHRNAKGSKLRYWLDKICRELTTQELDLVLKSWDRRVKDPGTSTKQKEEYRTCAGMIRNWRDYFKLKEKLEGPSFDATNGIVYQSDGTYHTVDFDEENGTYIVRDSEGTILYELL